MTKKFDARSKKAILVGYDGDSSNYRLYFSNTKTVYISRHVVFNENCKIFNPMTNDSDDKEITISFGPEERRVENIDMQQPNDTVESVEQESNCDGTSVEQESNCDGPAQPLLEKRVLRNRSRNRSAQPPPEKRELRNRANLKLPVRYEKNVLEYNIPENFQEAISSPEAAKWQGAIDDELESLSRNGTWKIVPRQPGMKAITSKWVFKIVKSKDGKTDRYKARLVARGFQQREGIDFVETFSPVVRYDSLRVLLAHITQEDLEMISFDVRTAFLYDDHEEEIYMQVPQGVDIGINSKSKNKMSDVNDTGNDVNDVVCMLQKSPYGLKQAPRCWNRKFKEFLYKFNFKEIDADNCIFVGKYNNHTVHLALFVDDGLIACESMNVLNEILKKLSAEFEITVGDASMFVGLQICRNREKKKCLYIKSLTQSAF